MGLNYGHAVADLPRRKAFGRRLSGRQGLADDRGGPLGAVRPSRPARCRPATTTIRWARSSTSAALWAEHRAIRPLRGGLRSASSSDPPRTCRLNHDSRAKRNVASGSAASTGPDRPRPCPRAPRRSRRTRCPAPPRCSVDQQIVAAVEQREVDDRTGGPGTCAVLVTVCGVAQIIGVEREPAQVSGDRRDRGVLLTGIGTECREQM